MRVVVEVMLMMMAMVRKWGYWKSQEQRWQRWAGGELGDGACWRWLASSDGDLLLTDLPPRPSPQSKCQSFNPGISLSLPGHPAPGCWSPGFENKLPGNLGFTCFPDNHRCYWASLTQLCNIRLCDWRNFKSSLTQFCSQTLPRVELVIATRESQHMNIMKQLNTDSIPSQFNKFGQSHQCHQVKYSLEEKKHKFGSIWPTRLSEWSCTVLREVSQLSC